MPLERVDAANQKMACNEAFFRLGCRAVHQASIRLARFASLRDAVVDGLTGLNRRDPSYLRISVREYDRRKYEGERHVYLAFIRMEAQLLRDTRRELRAVSGAKLTLFDTIAMALAEAADASTDTACPLCLRDRDL